MKTLRWNDLSPVERQRALQRPTQAKREELSARVAAIVATVRKRGDVALREFGALHDRVTLGTFEVTAGERESGRRSVRPEARNALVRAAKNIETFHRLQMPVPVTCDVAPGIRCERVARPVGRVGLYVPGGSARLPSTVLMLGIPSRLAGCPVRILCTPPRPDGSVDPHILEAASICGIDRIFKLGGAHAVAAMAFGTESVPKVDKIFGPGNAWVTEAKEQVAADPQGAACDMPAGPSEVLVIADDRASARFVAADLLSQAEHGPDSQVVLLSDSARLIRQVAAELRGQLETLPRAAIAKQALENSVAIEVASIDQAIAISNEYGPEHLILQVEEAAGWKDRITSAGSVFVGRWSPESAGDYASGTNHVLPTYGHARAVSGLSVDSFQKQITFQELTAEGLLGLGPVIEELAGLEELEAHRRAVSLRLEDLRVSERGDP